MMSRGVVSEAAWYKLAGGLGMAVSVGAVFSFGALSPEFMKLTNCSSEEASSIGLAGLVGFGFYVLPGLSFDRFGTRFGFIVGVCLAILGLGGASVALVLRSSYVVVAIFWACAGHAMAWLLCANLLSNVKSWEPGARGYVVGSLQAFSGASAPLFIGIWRSDLFGAKSLVPFLLFILAWTLCSVAIAVLTGGGTDDLQEAGIFDAKSKHRFYRLQLYIAALLVLIVAAGLATQTQDWASYVIVAALFAGVPAVLFLFREKRSQLDDRVKDPHEDVDDKDKDEAVITLAAPVEEGGGLVEPLLPSPPQDIEPLAALGPLWIEFWELFLVFAILTGGALSTSISMVSIARSLGTCEFATISAFSLTLLTASDAFARMSGGVLINSKTLDGSLVLAAGALFLGASHTAFSAAHGLNLHQGPFSTPRAYLFLAAAAMSGAADGFAWSACPWLTQARFGAARYGNNFGIVALAAIIGQTLFLKAIQPIGDVPSDDDDRHPSSFRCATIDDDDDESCYGGNCFSVFHRTCQAAALVALLGALDLERRRRNRLQSIIHKDGSSIISS